MLTYAYYERETIIFYGFIYIGKTMSLRGVTCDPVMRRSNCSAPIPHGQRRGQRK